MSDVEKFYYAIQGKLGGTRRWQDLDASEQKLFTQAVSIILQLGSI